MTEQAKDQTVSNPVEAVVMWRSMNEAPKDGTKIIAWFEPNEINAPEKAKPWVTWWELKQFKDGTGKHIGDPFGQWEVKGWSEPLSYAPVRWITKPTDT